MYKKGDLVWVSSEHLKAPSRPSKKLDDKWRGPFEVLKPVRKGAYKLKTPQSWKVHKTFNEEYLKLFKKPEYESQQKPPPPPPDVVDGTLEYEVEEILDSRLSRGKLQYLVKWKGYLPEENTWEPEANVEGSPDAIKDFHKKYPSAPRRIRTLLAFRKLENLTTVHEDANAERG
jgi:hypothetical protein